MDDDETEPPMNPILSYTLAAQGPDTCWLVIRYHDPTSMEVCSEVRFDAVTALFTVGEAISAAMRVLLNAHEQGFEAACDLHGLTLEIEPPDLSDVNLTVEYILQAKPEAG